MMQDVRGGNVSAYANEVLYCDGREQKRRASGRKSGHLRVPVAKKDGATFEI
jgi:hypothetical protein